MNIYTKFKAYQGSDPDYISADADSFLWNNSADVFKAFKVPKMCESNLWSGL